MLEIQVAEVDAGTEQRAERALQAGGVQSRGQQEAGFGELERLGHAGSMAATGKSCYRSAGAGGADQPAGGCATAAVAAGGPRPTTSTSGSFHGPLTR